MRAVLTPKERIVIEGIQQGLDLMTAVIRAYNVQTTSAAQAIANRLLAKQNFYLEFQRVQGKSIPRVDDVIEMLWLLASNRKTPTKYRLEALNLITRITSGQTDDDIEQLGRNIDTSAKLLESLAKTVESK